VSQGHGTSEVVDGGNGLQILQGVAEGVLDKKFKLPTRAGHSAWGVVQGNSSVLVWLQPLANGGLWAHVGTICG
jgi:hypothetical protein